MSTRVAIIAEGPIDHLLLPPLLSRIAMDKAQFTWPLLPTDGADILPVRRRGHGGVLDTVRKLVKWFEQVPPDHDIFVILLDRKTKPVQGEIKSLIQGKHRFLLGIAIEEIEAWWLGDRTNTLAWSGLRGALGNCRYGDPSYQAERDDNPKTTLDELTRVSDRFDRHYGEGDTDMAREFAVEYWDKGARLDEIATQCPRGFGDFQRDAANALRAAKARARRLI